MQFGDGAVAPNSRIRLRLVQLRSRGEEWMPEPCRSCERRTEDFGGCRCQAFLLTADANATDPACSLAPAHHVVESVLLEVNSGAPAISQPVRGSSLHDLQAQTADVWSYRMSPE